MRSAGNFHPEWGYLAPAPSFIRTARMVLVAAAVGATAGAGVVFSLLGQPADVDVATRTLAAPVGGADPAASESQTHSTVPSPQATASLAETPAGSDGAAAPKKVAAKKRRTAPLYASHGGVLSGDYYGAASGLFTNGANSYRADRWGGYQDRDYYDR